MSQDHDDDPVWPEIETEQQFGDHGRRSQSGEYGAEEIGCSNKEVEQPHAEPR